MLLQHQLGYGECTRTGRTGPSSKPCSSCPSQIPPAQLELQMGAFLPPSFTIPKAGQLPHLNLQDFLTGNIALCPSLLFKLTALFSKPDTGNSWSHRCLSTQGCCASFQPWLWALLSDQRAQGHPGCSFSCGLQGSLCQGHPVNRQRLALNSPAGNFLLNNFVLPVRTAEPL